jgi:hypothetical protein
MAHPEKSLAVSPTCHPSSPSPSGLCLQRCSPARMLCSPHCSSAGPERSLAVSPTCHPSSPSPSGLCLQRCSPARMLCSPHCSSAGPAATARMYSSSSVQPFVCKAKTISLSRRPFPPFSSHLVTVSRAMVAAAAGRSPRLVTPWSRVATRLVPSSLVMLPPGGLAPSQSLVVVSAALVGVCPLP